MEHQTSSDNLNLLPTNKDNNPRTLFMVYLKGILMGIADIVPGVSGGTVALITGIYQRLISAISSIDPKILSIWYKDGFIKGFVNVWKHVDATFLVCLIVGIATAFITVSGYITNLLAHEPLKIWSFFFGLVFASIFLLLAEVKTWNVKKAILLAVGLVSAVGIVSLPVATGTPSLPFLFFAGAIAICAMILPGISGSFILLILGAYQAVLLAVSEKDIATLATVISGMIFGLLSFSKFLKWLLNRYYQETLALLIGFIAGSLAKLYPWKIELNGVSSNVLPSMYPHDPQLLSSLSFMILGTLVILGVFLLEKLFGTRSQ